MMARERTPYETTIPYPGDIASETGLLGLRQFSFGVYALRLNRRSSSPMLHETRMGRPCGQ